MLCVCVCVLFYLMTNSNLNSQPKIQRSLWSGLLSSSLHILEGTLVFITPITSFYLSYLCSEFLLYWFCSLLLLTDISPQLLNFNCLSFLFSSLFILSYISARFFFHLCLLTFFILCFKRTCMLLLKIQSIF